jgi:hypothetical protein
MLILAAILLALLLLALPPLPKTTILVISQGLHLLL